MVRASGSSLISDEVKLRGAGRRPHAEREVGDRTASSRRGAGVRATLARAVATSERRHWGYRRACLSPPRLYVAWATKLRSIT
ncbi:hypothetical protein PAHAL_2G253600 [Panicum hallii]|uniref:Uncharacterized protein n=1 Tax=Panicum hallii TaxID=206008 RepID=A0A2T8KQB2_9POAL|nr:hypothetical protein PAHAL_2G253600 [Panicum hallii]